MVKKNKSNNLQGTHHRIDTEITWIQAHDAKVTLFRFLLHTMLPKRIIKVKKDSDHVATIRPGCRVL